MKTIKDRIYDYLVRKNGMVQKEYEWFVMEHLYEHDAHRFKHWFVLLKLILHYRILKKTTPCLYHDMNLSYKQNSEERKKIDIELELQIVESNKIVLSWKSSSEICNIYRSVDGNKYDFVEKVMHIQYYSDFSVKPNTIYFYKVKVSNDGEHYSPFSKALKVKTKIEKSNDLTNKQLLKTSSKIAEAVLMIKRCSSHEVVLIWEANANICNVYRSSNGKDYSFLIKICGENICYDTTVQANSQYYYKVKVSNNGENYSSFSNVINVKTKAEGKYDLLFERRSLCLNGAESEYKHRISEMHLAKMLMKYDTISFDIFDTLILRPFQKPSDLFMLVGQKLGIMDFSSIRIQAEETARQLNKSKRGNREVCIEDIYEIVERKTGIRSEQGVQVEMEVEFDLCFANPYMLRVFNLVRHQGKKIIAISDMYYSKNVMKLLLEKKGYKGFDDLIISCDYNTSKREGKLYDIALKKYNNVVGSTFVHIGDNEKTDIEIPKGMGIETYYYCSVNNKGNRYRATNMSYLIGSAYSGVVNAHLHSGIKGYSPYYEVGFVYAGIYVLGFCNWIYKLVKQKNITKILFLAREGDIYQRVFNQLFDDIETEYVLWSRVPVVKTVVNRNRHPYLLQLVHHKAHAIYKSNVATLFDRVGIGNLKKYFLQYRINEEEFVSENNEKIIEELLTDHWDEVCDCYKEDAKEIQEYLESIIGTHSNVAVVDVGWSGNNVLQIKYLIENVYQKECKVECFLAATREVNSTYMATMMQSEEVNTYIFSNLYNTELHDFHQSTNNRLNSFFFEILTQSCTPTFLGFHAGNIMYDIPEVENFEHNREIHKGILDFSALYVSIFKKYPYMLNISGHDAYMPFRLFASDLTWIRNYFSDYVFGRDLFATQQEAVMETVKEVMEHAGV